VATKISALVRDEVWDKIFVIFQNFDMVVSFALERYTARKSSWRWGLA